MPISRRDDTSLNMKGSALDKHLAERQVHSYRNGQLDPGEMLGVLNHISGCLACRELAAPANETFAAAKSWYSGLSGNADSHLTEEEAEAIVDGKTILADRRRH